jgi:diaminopimelate epimerase
MPNIKFTKMNGLGNDFVILDYSEYQKIKTCIYDTIQ